MTVASSVLWLGFLAFVVAMLALDLGVFHRRNRTIGYREALRWTVFWIALALVFSIFVFFAYEYRWPGVGVEPGNALSGKQAVLQYLTGYVIEKSLSLDNIFVIALIFAYYGVPGKYQHRVLFWGILGALVMRGALILVGAAMIARFDWMVYIFGAALFWAAARMLAAQSEKVDPGRSALVRLVRRFCPVSPCMEGGSFVTHVDGRRAVTPLFVTLLIIESADVVFALDSIPAIFAVTRDPFLVFTFNVFAILGLRSLYFALAAMVTRFRYLKISLVVLLAYVGVKMMLSHHYPIPTAVSLAVIVGILGAGIAASIVQSQREGASAAEVRSQ